MHECIHMITYKSGAQWKVRLIYDWNTWISAVTYLKYFYLKYYLSKIFHYLYLNKNSRVYLLLDT